LGSGVYLVGMFLKFFIKYFSFITWFGMDVGKAINVFILA